MSGTGEHTHHGIDYVEITADDVGRARAFYEQAFGWSFNEYGPGYLGIRKPTGGEYGGLCQGERPQAGGPLVVLFSEDLEATLESVRRAGGSIVQEPFAFPGGRRFHFKDPSGNELAVWTTQGGLDIV